MKKSEVMTPANLTEFLTPKGVKLQGSWLGTKNPKRVIIWTHGFTSNMFSKLGITRLLAKGSTAVLMYNNRGHEIVARISRPNDKELSKDRFGGAAHEVFTDCVDDIQGAINFAKQCGAKEVFLAGHSTGCQKSTYYAAKKMNPIVKGIILAAPISDRAAEIYLRGQKKVDAAVKVAREYVRTGRHRTLLPSTVWHEKVDAQRFFSLYASGSPEDIFPYERKGGSSKLLRSIKKPVLVLLAEHDEYDGHGAEFLSTWYADQIYSGEVEIVRGVGHGFAGGERQAARAIARFMKERYN